MMNKKNLWFLTLFSLVLVLSIYYVTMPEDLLAASTQGLNTTISKDNDKDISVTITESDAITALKVEDTAATKDAINTLQEQLTDTKTSTEEKNSLYEQIQTINTNSGLEETIEEQITTNYNCDAFTKIENTYWAIRKVGEDIKPYVISDELLKKALLSYSSG